MNRNKINPEIAVENVFSFPFTLTASQEKTKDDVEWEQKGEVINFST